MGILSFLGLENNKKPVEKFEVVNDLVNLTYDEYFSRFSRIKTLIEANPVIMGNINNVFCHEYLDERLNSDIMPLGSGNMHDVYSIYTCEIKDNDKDISLALRLANTRFPYRLKDEDGYANYGLFSELSSFCDAFIRGQNPPYFIGLVEWSDNDKYKEGIVGFITEDVTKRKTLKSYTTRPNALVECLVVTDFRGKMTKFFIDPVMSDGYKLTTLDYADNTIKVDYSLK
jgi:hypothetical protein